jgi:SAM-dependent methyltransferase
MQIQTAVPDNSHIYYQGQYWNEFQPVLEYMCENFTGDKNKWWAQDFKERFCQTPFEHGLVLNCGNGWVERAFIDMGIVNRITAFDYLIDLLRIAKEERGDRPIFYFQADVNRIDFRENQFDLIVNVASLHHVQYINRLCHIMCKAIKENGILVNYDYIGPHRNQYSFKQWHYINKVNRSLPDFIQKSPIIKAHLPTMLHVDPTEAIHSELIIESVSRYFEIFERHDTGGGIAYELLTHNPKLKNVPADKLDFHIRRILTLDREYTNLKRVPPLFSYFIAKPKKSILSEDAKLKHYQKVEGLREEKARKRRGVYSNGHYLIMILHYLKGRLAKGVVSLKHLKNLVRARLKNILMR